MKSIGIIFGPNGVGKGTLAAKLTDHFQLYHLNMGNLIRHWIEIHARQEFQEFIDNGRLIPDEIVKEVLEHRFPKHEFDSNIVAEGFPRTQSQISILRDLCERLDLKTAWVIVLNAPLEVISERLALRVMAPDGEVYHLKYNPPPSHFTPDELIRREDDRPEIVEKRYQEFVTNTLECLSDQIFKDVPTCNIDATQTISEVFEEAREFIENI